MSLEQDEYYMQLALEQASLAFSQGEVPVGAVVVQEGVVIGRGFNQPISSYDPSAHAEVMALRDAAESQQNYRLLQATLYVTIEPCTMCAGALVHARVDRVVYGATEPKSGVAHSNGCLFEGEHLNHRVSVTGSVMAKECSAIMSDFFQQRRRATKMLRAKVQADS